MRPKSTNEFESKTIDKAKPLGVQFAMNGTIKEINLNSNGSNLRSKLINDKSSLICIFEEIFGSNKQTNSNALGAASENNFGSKGFSAADINPTRVGLKSANTAFRTKTRTARPPLVKSMQHFSN